MAVLIPVIQSPVGSHWWHSVAPRCCVLWRLNGMGRGTPLLSPTSRATPSEWSSLMHEHMAQLPLRLPLPNGWWSKKVWSGAWVALPGHASLPALLRSDRDANKNISFFGPGPRGGGGGDYSVKVPE